MGFVAMHMAIHVAMHGPIFKLTDAAPVEHIKTRTSLNYGLITELDGLSRVSRVNLLVECILRQS